MKFKKIRVAICLFAGFLLVFLLSFGVQVSSYQKYACRLTRNIQKLNSSLKILGWTQADLDLVKQQSNPGVYLIDLISETGEVFRPTAQSSNLSSGQIVPFSTWDTIFTELIPRYDDNAKEVSVILHRGTLGNREFKFWIPQSLNETNVDIVGKYTAVLLANGLTSLGAESVTISDERVAEEVKKLYDPYYAGNGEYKDKIDVEITLKDGSSPFTVEVDIPDAVKRFNSSDNQAENLNEQIKDFALDISESVKNAMQAQDISIDEISNILVPCDRHTFVKLALIEKLFAGTFGIKNLKSDEAKKYLNKLERFPYFDNQAGTMQDVNAWGEGTKFEISNILPVENIGIATQQSRAPPLFNPNDGKIIGIDLGSTGVKISVIKDGVPVQEERYESIYGKTVGETEKVLIDKIKDLLQKSNIGFGDIDAVGISWAGPVNGNKVVGASKIRFDMIGSPLDEIKNFPDSLRKNFLNEGLKERVPVVMVNDGDAGGFNVYLKEGRPSKVAFLGLGGGLAFTKLTNGSFVQGFNEWGRSELDMVNNNVQAFTTHALTTGYLSGTGIANIARSLGMNVTDAKGVSDLFEQNDEDALKVVDIVAESLAESIYWLQKTYGDLDSVLLGGGAMQGQFGQTIKDKAQFLLKNKYQIDIQLKCCDNPEYAVAYGAAQYANQVRQVIREDINWIKDFLSSNWWNEQKKWDEFIGKANSIDEKIIKSVLEEARIKSIPFVDIHDTEHFFDSAETAVWFMDLLDALKSETLRMKITKKAINVLFGTEWDVSPETTGVPIVQSIRNVFDKFGKENLIKLRDYIKRINIYTERVSMEGVRSELLRDIDMYLISDYVQDKEVFK